MKTRWRSTLAGAALLGALAMTVGDQARAEESPAVQQQLLGPGLYVFQTRTRSSTCQDSERNGFVTSFVAALDGIPGATSMTMSLVNTPHFKRWSLQMTPTDVLQGHSHIGKSPDGPDAQFSMQKKDERWIGTGFRTYQGKLDGKPARCRVDFDTLLKRIDT